MDKLPTKDNSLVIFKDGIFILWHPFHVRMDSPCQGPVPELVRPQHNGLEKLQNVIEVSNSKVFLMSFKFKLYFTK